MPRSRRVPAQAKQVQHEFNAVNRGVYVSDNLPFLRSLNTESVDLVCIDPPFAKNETFTGDKLKPPLSDQELEIERRLLAHWGISSESEANEAGIVWPDDGKTKGGYTDIWSWEKDVHEDWLDSIETSHEGISKVIEATRYVHGDSIAAYLCYMAIRIIELYRVLKSTGSLYLHCDHTANGYLRQLLDGVFGSDNFRNEIVWRSTSAHSDSSRYGANTETILFYTKTNKWTWNSLHMPYDDKYRARFKFQDPDGRLWTDGDITAKGLSGGGYEYEYKGATSLWRVPLETMQRLDSEGTLYFTRTGGIRLKKYLDELRGRPVQQLWEDIDPINSQAKERTGYPTQKPVLLAERIIQASSNSGDVVLDCFAGCAYTAVAAERLNRQWVACDINPRAWTVFKRQFNKTQLVLLRCNDETTGQKVMANEPVVTIHGPGELPVRTSPEVESTPQSFALPTRQFKVPASLIPESDMLRQLLELSEYKAWCCGWANRMPDGSIVKTNRNFHLDHIAPKSKEGTSNDIQNRAPMCPHHNIRKNNRQVALSQYRQEIADASEMMVNSVNELINLDKALSEANILYGQAYAAKYPLGI